MEIKKKQVQDLTIKLPKWWQALIFRVKALCFQLKRTWQNRWVDPVKRFSFSDQLIKAPILGESTSVLWPIQMEGPEIKLIAGKIQNLRQAAACFHGLEVPGGQVFSFWKHLGRLRKRKGYAVGREIREGCVIPTIGGGICQLSNALYDAALKAGLEIVERHGHTAVIPGSLAETHRDATVFWNYVDLRFRAQESFRLEVLLQDGQLKVRIRAKELVHHEKRALVSKRSEVIRLEKSCYTCGKEACFRYVAPDVRQNYGRTAFLLDAYWPEYQCYIEKQMKARDLLLRPLNPSWFRRKAYLPPHSNLLTKYAMTQALKRAWALRHLPAQGGALQKALQKYDQALADRYATYLQAEDLHLIVSQNLLPYLWKKGLLGGRKFEVLMTRLPVIELEKNLDEASQRHPESKTLKDFRFAQDLAQAEFEALQVADKIVTPHPRIAELFPQTSHLLKWHLPNSVCPRKLEGKALLFAAPTLGRKGAYEVRELAKHSDLQIFYHPKNLEVEEFWDGISARPFHSQNINQVAAVIAPSFVENQPRYLLTYLQLGIPVIASDACGLDNTPGVDSFKTGDFESMKLLISNQLTTR